MKFRKPPALLSKVVKHEEQMMLKFNEIAKKYEEVFSEYGCSLKMQMQWDNCLSIRQSVVNYRILLKNGYICSIYFYIEKDGKKLRLQSDDGEADWYELSNTSDITWITWILGWKIQLFTDAEDFEEELTYFGELLEEYRDRLN